VLYIGIGHSHVVKFGTMHTSLSQFYPQREREKQKHIPVSASVALIPSGQSWGRNRGEALAWEPS
jgi:hypothetical protein